jgi:hypothetical protein
MDAGGEREVAGEDRLKNAEMQSSQRSAEKNNDASGAVNSALLCALRVSAFIGKSKG